MIFSNWSIPIRILCCMLCCWHFPKLTFSFQPVNTHPNSMLHVVLLTFPKIDFFFLAGQYPSECYVACCVVVICEQLFVCSRSIPIRILCCMLCCGYLQIAVSFQAVNTSEIFVACCVVSICKQLFVSSRSIPIRILCCMLVCGYLQEIAVCFQPANTHPNSMLHVVSWVFAKKQMMFSSWSIHIRILCCMLCCWHFPKFTFSFQPVNTNPNSMLYVVLRVFARNRCWFLAS